MRVALCVPSRGRPETFEQFLQSWEETTAGCSDVLLRNGVKDPLLDEYRRFEGRCVRHVGPDDGYNTTWEGTAGYAPAQQDLYEWFPGYDAYVTIEDDCVLHTEGFDLILLESLAGSCRVEELRDRACTIVVQAFSAGWVHRVGSLCIPEVGEQAFQVSKYLATKAGLYGVSEVEFTHMPLLAAYGYEGVERPGAVSLPDVVTRFRAEEKYVNEVWLPENEDRILARL